MTKLWLTLLFFCALSLKSISWQDHNNLDDTSFKRFANQEAWVDSVANSLTLDEKIAQFFMLGVYPTQGETNRSYVENVIKKYNIGGVILFKGHPIQAAQWNNSFQKAAKTPLFISVDGEWGINMRLDSTIQYPRQLTLGAIQDDDLIYQMGQQIALECKAVGININLAPDMDINNNINNPVINDRSFGEDKYNVALKALAYAQGMQSQNIMAVGKHFPGHGDTDTDSHKDMPIIKHSRARLDSIELYPFKVAVQNEVKGIMVAHLNIPALDNTENLPSSLSKKIITDLLKTEMGFNGLVFSDALNMKGVTKYYEPGEVDKIAFLAGTDVLVVSEDIPKGIEMIKKAIKKGDITEQYINERLKKVLENKYWLQLDKSPIVDVSKVSGVLNLKTSKELNKQL
ncbi:MAG: glycoside hydrolase family 3 N-terminal domain-containing protein [Chitinophagales bacterium]